MNVERRMSISSYLILHRRAVRRSERASPREPRWSRWYVPWLAAALTLVGLPVAAIAALEIVTATHQPLLMPATRSSTADRGSEVEMIGDGTLIRWDR